MNSLDTVRSLVTILRATHPEIRSIFHNGGCYRLFQMLSLIDPRAEAYTDHNHVWTHIAGHFIDIDGITRKVPKNTEPMDPAMAERAKHWHDQQFWGMPAPGQMPSAAPRADAAPPPEACPVVVTPEIRQRLRNGFEVQYGTDGGTIVYLRGESYTMQLPLIAFTNNADLMMWLGAALAPEPATPVLEPGNYAVVRQGDTLRHIAFVHLGSGKRWPEIVEANEARFRELGWNGSAKIPEEPASPGHWLFPGQKLRLPAQ